MPQSLVNIVVHAIFSTHKHQPFLYDKTLRREFHSYMAVIMQNLHCTPIIINGVEDHVHILFCLGKEASISHTIGELKRVSSIWIKEKSNEPMLSNFHWQHGYGAFGVSQSNIERVKQYIETQEEHHKKISFQDELRLFFKKHKMKFDERYIWD